MLHSASPLRRPDADPPAAGDALSDPVEILAPQAAAPLVLVCDHASNHFPPDLLFLGLPEEQRRRHIAWDIGAAEVCRQLSRRLAATAVLGGVSRLVIDCNRALGHPASICPFSDGTPVPGNQNLSAEATARRARLYFHPYHQAVASQLRRVEQAGAVAAVVAIHSFTPRMNGFHRPWHVGVLWDRDPRLAVPLMQSLARRDGLCVGDNQPYSGRDDVNHTIRTHGADPGRPHVSIEIRQDLIGDPAGCRRWAGLLGEVLIEVLADSEWGRRAYYGSAEHS